VGFLRDAILDNEGLRLSATQKRATFNHALTSLKDGDRKAEPIAKQQCKVARVAR
jgi:hypothetical protein